MIKAILCDRDGVLINSEIVNIGASLQALFDMGVMTHADDEMIIMGKHPQDYVADFVEKYDIDGEEFLTRRKKIYNERLFETNVFTDTVSALRDAKSRGLYIGLVTSANRTITQDVLTHFALDDLFDVIVSFDDCTQRKPHPEPYMKGAELLHVEPMDCMVFEDSPIGLHAAKSAGMHCIIRLNEKNRNLAFEEADLIVENLCDAQKLIDDLCKK